MIPTSIGKGESNICIIFSGKLNIKGWGYLNGLSKAWKTKSVHDNRAELCDTKTIEYSLKMAKKIRENISSSRFERTIEEFQSASIYLAYSLLGILYVIFSLLGENSSIVLRDGNWILIS